MWLEYKLICRLRYDFVGCYIHDKFMNVHLMLQKCADAITDVLSDNASELSFGYVLGILFRTFAFCPQFIDCDLIEVSSQC